MAGIASASESGRAAQPDDPTVMLLIDTSSSMAGERLQQAQTALTATVDAFTPGQAVGLRNYGGDCGDAGSVLVPIGSDNRPQLRSAITALVADGGTPTPDAILGAAADLADATGRREIVLVSDGESTCGDPCATVAQLKNEQGIDVTIHAVGFKAPDTAEAELECIAEAGGGTYFSAHDLPTLLGALKTVAGPEPVGATPVGATPVGGTPQVPSVPVGPVDAGTGSSGDAAVLLPLVIVGGTAIAAGFAPVRRPLRRR